MFKLGADPEFFVSHGGIPVSAHDLVPGTKKEPYKLADGAAIQADGTAVEFNIKPATTAQEFKDNTLGALELIRKMVPGKYKFEFKPAVFYDYSYFNTLPMCAKELGCEPDYNAVNGAVNPTPTPAGKYETMRTAAGHLHLGWIEGADIEDQSHRFDCQHMALKCDIAFRPQMKYWDEDKDRSFLYGKTACYRPKSYGVEYRALSVAWLQYPDLYPHIFGTAKKVYDLMSAGVTSHEQFIYALPRFKPEMLTKKLEM